MPALAMARKILTEEMPRLKQLGVKKAGIFGSVARGDERPGSDVDILLELGSDHKLTLLSMVDLEIALSEKLRRKADVVIAGSLKPLVRDRVLNEVVYVES
jgi:predicted nucleotidyltransferase